MAKFPHGITSCSLRPVILKVIAKREWLFNQRRKIATSPSEFYCMTRFLHRHFLLMMLMAGAVGLPAPAAEARKNFEILRISPLRIMCFTTPCPPWNAMAISQGTDMPGPHPLYLGRLPALRGAKPAVARIARIWRNKDCVIIRGRLDTSRQRPTLFVSSILRSC